MSVRRRLDQLERSIPIQWPRCRTCGGYAGGGVLALEIVFEPVPWHEDDPPKPRCSACGGPVEVDGFAPDDLLPPGSLGRIFRVGFAAPRGAPVEATPTVRMGLGPPGLPPA